MSTPKMTPDQQKKAVALVLTHGMTKISVAKRYGVSHSTICQLVIAAGKGQC